MTKPTLISQADLKRMAAVAKREGVIVEIEVDGRIIRVRPDEPTPRPSSLPDDFAL